ncbi:c-type heme family protein [Desulfatirhabdium butyrativorans]|uniref:c-type heme family protein n=1 Tax=Desulfatirhabdium butyrativorans TaxID=340467 RepID=UPI0004002B09|nr:DUF3365 domain-containing protein [Desulfatirhabdium butyrativorans]
MKSSEKALSSRHHSTIQNKFLIGLAVIFLMLGVVFLFALHIHLREILHIETEANAEIVFSHLTALQNYVRTMLRPAARQVLPPDEFLLEAMSTSFVTRKVLVDLNSEKDQYVYRRVAVSPRNPLSAANEMERELIQYFQEHPEKSTRTDYRMIGEREYYVMARPVHFERECLMCHGNPTDAPRVLIERYGATNGFGRSEGELAGLDLVAMPVDKSLQHIREAITLFGGFFFVVALGMFLLISFFFNRLVVTNLRRLSGIFRETFQHPKDQLILDRLDEGDEIRSLLEAFEAFAFHLKEARLQLEDYAANLESKVRRRTADLSREAAEHRTDVRLFVELLGDLSKSERPDDLLQTALPRIAQRFGATRSAYLCAPLGRHRFVWPGPEAEFLIPKDWLALIQDGQVRMENERVYVPVSSLEWNRGILALIWDGRTRPDIAPEILAALGQQVGIALENLEAVDAMLTQNKLLERIFDGISDPMLLVDAAGAIILANPSARNLSETIRPKASLAAWFQALTGFREPDERLISSLCAQTPSNLEFELTGPRHFSVNVYPLRNSEDNDRAVVYIRETTSEKRLLARMQQSEKLSALGRLAAGLAHEINNPLGVIQCYAQLLQKSQMEPQVRADLDIILNHTRKAQAILKGLLGMARRNSDGASGNADLNEVIRGIVQIFRVQTEASGVALDIDLAQDIPAVAADTSAIEQILTNLLVNALDAVPDRTGRILIRTSMDRNQQAVLLQVSDNGPGIAAEHVKQIFDPFFTTKEIGKGTGLGLTVVYELMTEIGGTIDVHPGPGATFELHFPVAPPHDAGLTGMASDQGCPA